MINKSKVIEFLQIDDINDEGLKIINHRANNLSNLQ